MEDVYYHTPAGSHQVDIDEGTTPDCRHLKSKVPGEQAGKRRLQPLGISLRL